LGGGAGARLDTYREITRWEMGKEPSNVRKGGIDCRACILDVRCVLFIPPILGLRTLRGTINDIGWYLHCIWFDQKAQAKGNCTTSYNRIRKTREGMNNVPEKEYKKIDIYKDKS
jgi:hypothetical protein